MRSPHPQTVEPRHPGNMGIRRPVDLGESTLVRKWKRLPEDGWIFVRFDRLSVRTQIRRGGRRGPVREGVLRYAGRGCQVHRAVNLAALID